MKIINHTDLRLTIYVGKEVDDKIEPLHVVVLDPNEENSMPDDRDRVYVIDKVKDINANVNVKPIPS